MQKKLSAQAAGATLKQLKQIARAKKMTLPALIDEILANYVISDTIDTQEKLIAPIIRDILSDTEKISEERLSELLAQSSLATITAMHALLFEYAPPALRRKKESQNIKFFPRKQDP